MQKKVRGKSIRLVVYVGSEKDRGITVSIFPGDEGWYMDIGKQFIRSLHEAAK
ncbi:MAG: hypothetical protein LUP94_02910 [Candidatus Methanomethylicus sp.]|nr:hypothetical protein [Candidatus Methanomethylicus sp.]